MSNIAIRVEGLSKRYRIGLKEEMHDTLVGAIADFVKRPVKNLQRLRKLSTFSEDSHESEDIIWALKDVSFEVKRGEVIGIIGRNGAGKTTLLKILSRITDPTVGRAMVYGRVGSLLEVGTGFHSELTGRENTYLNGTILGMKKAEVDRKFDEIVDFSGVEKFIDTPVKRYSSGMKVRLAFAVAAHLEPQILLVDEVLAVGDVAFQKKCLGKMDSVSRGGRTVLFVSHQMTAVQSLCERAILLNDGIVTKYDKTEAVMEQYLKESFESPEISLAERRDRKGTGNIRFVSVTYQNERRQNVNSLRIGQNAILKFCYENHVNRDLKRLCLAVGIDNQMGQRIALLSNELTNQVFSNVPAEVNSIEIHLERIPLVPGRYSLTVYCTINGVVADWVKNAAFLDVEGGDYYGTGKLPQASNGNFLINHHYQIKETSPDVIDE
jgi:lipopolysaccharide transport system ATP-binding protein